MTNKLFLTAFFLFFIHMLEEYFTSFYAIDKSFLMTIGRVGTDHSAAFLVYQLIVMAILFGAYLLVKQKRYVKVLLIILLAVTFLELQHVYEAIKLQKYYPGLYTALLFPVLSFYLYKRIKENEDNKLDKGYH